MKKRATKELEYYKTLYLNLEKMEHNIGDGKMPIKIENDALEAVIILKDKTRKCIEALEEQLK